MTEPPKRPGPESTLADVRDRLIDSGLALLGSSGVDIGLDAITLSSAMQAAGVSRSTAYRSLADDELSPQAVLHREVQSALLTRDQRDESRQVLEAAALEELARHSDALENGDVRSRTYAMRSLIRVGCNTSLKGVIESTDRSVLTALYGALRSSDQSDWRLAAIKKGERALIEMFTSFYAGFLDLFHYQPKPEFGLSRFATTAASLVEGIALRHGLNEHVDAIDLPTGLDGELEEWSLFAIGFEKLAIGMLEPVNPAEPFADLQNY